MSTSVGSTGQIAVGLASGMVDYLNTNQGAVMSILTLVYVIATIALVWVGLRQTKAASRTIQLYEKTEEARVRPFVFFDLVAEPFAVMAVLKNTGLTPAFEVKVKVTPELLVECAGRKMHVPFVEHPVGFLAPGRELQSAAGFGAVFSDDYPDPVFHVCVSYRDVNGKEYSESARIDLSYRNMTLRIGKADIGKELAGIHEVLKTVTSARFKPLFRIVAEKDFQEEQENLWKTAKEQTQQLRTQQSQPSVVADHSASPAPKLPSEEQCSIQNPEPHYKPEERSHGLSPQNRSEMAKRKQRKSRNSRQ